ncbi:MAG: Uncharacterized protein FD165_1801 [Gammaproteobacteria bacterium]|nr:MAG: Uncharacterized protein FD165_1801 [Gammaproteobacteria bacterium]TND04374.1 MAG: Uncharacterized protein FD120_1488 [Gammaproteobacteria bacterium]
MVWKQLIAVLSMAVVLGGALAGCDQGSSGGHMGQMMGGGMMGRIPAGDNDAPLPEAHSPGAKLFQQYCGRCHAPPTPTAHSAQEWLAVVARMKQHMVTQAAAVPDTEQLQEIIAYLQRHAG